MQGAGFAHHPLALKQGFGIKSTAWFCHLCRFQLPVFVNQKDSMNYKQDVFTLSKLQVASEIRN